MWKWKLEQVVVKEENPPSCVALPGFEESTVLSSCVFSRSSCEVIYLLFPVFGNLKVSTLWNDAKVNLSTEDDKRKRTDNH